MTLLPENLNPLINSIEAVFPSLVGAAAAILASLVAGFIFSRTFGRLLLNRNLSSLHTEFFNKLVKWCFLLIGIVIALNILGLERSVMSIIAGGGVMAIVLGFAFKEIGENFLAGFFLAFSRPFQVGDLIDSEGMNGQVRSVEMRYTHIRTEDGKDIFIPNAQIFNRPLVNYTRDGLRRFSFVVGIDYANDSIQACQVLLTATQGISGVLNEPASGAMVSAMQPQYIEILVYYWVNMFVDDKRSPAIRTAVMDACRRSLLQEGFTISSECTSNISLAVERQIAVSLDRAD